MIAHLLAMALAVAATAPAADAPTPAGHDVRQLLAILASAGDDRETGDLTNEQHYLASNERDLHLIEGDVRGRGGVLIAVGADPGYILAAWADPSALIFIDLDPAIVQLHRIYAAFFRHANTPAQFLALWADAGVDDAARVSISKTIAVDAADGAALQALLAEAAPAIARRFAALERRMSAAGVAWLLGDDALYQRTRDLVRGDKVHALRGDLTRAGVARTLGERLHEHGHTLGLLYLSNIEQYFLYTTDFRANIAALPFAPDGLVLRTLPGRPAGFEYIVEDGAHFQQLVQDRRVRSVYRIRGFHRGDHLAGRTRHRIDP
jgi:hypothetical protein